MMRGLHTRRLSATLGVVAGLALSAPVLATTPDPLDQFLSERGLLEAPAPTLPAQAITDLSALVVHAIGFVGTPYRLGGSDVETGFDCSGFVQAAFRQSMGIALPRRAAEQAEATHGIDADRLLPGDLVFFNTQGREFSHVGIYVGEGRFIHSPRAGAEVRLEPMTGRYWQTRFNGARRVSAWGDGASAALAQ